MIPTLHHNLDYKVVSVDEDNCTLQMQISRSFVHVMPALLLSLQDTFRYLSNRVKVSEALARSADPVEIAKNQQRKKHFEELVLKVFDSVRRGLTDRQAIRATRDHFHKREMFLTCYEIEMVARAAGRFRKSQKIVSDKTVKSVSC